MKRYLGMKDTIRTRRGSVQSNDKKELLFGNKFMSCIFQLLQDNTIVEARGKVKKGGDGGRLHLIVKRVVSAVKASALGTAELQQGEAVTVSSGVKK